VPAPLSRIFLLVCGLLVAGSSAPVFAQSSPRDGQHDFDWLVGTWRFHRTRLLHPLTGSTTWVEVEGSLVNSKIWDGRASLDESVAPGPTGRAEGLTLNLYNPQARQWSLYSATSRNGTIGVPSIGEFRNGRGEFFNQELFDGRAILVRQIWSEITPTSARFEQAFSDDGGKTWEVNWVSVFTRVSEGSAGSRSAPPPAR